MDLKEKIKKSQDMSQELHDLRVEINEEEKQLKYKEYISYIGKYFRLDHDDSPCGDDAYVKIVNVDMTNFHIIEVGTQSIRFQFFGVAFKFRLFDGTKEGFDSAFKSTSDYLFNC